MTIRDQVLAFHRAGGIPVLESPQVPPDDCVRLRARLVAENFFELLDALFGNGSIARPGSPALMRARYQIACVIADATLDVDIVALADACADLDYVVEGTRLEFGIDGRPIAHAVHVSNMAKFGEGSHVREDGKIMKPPGWKPPDIAGLIRQQQEVRAVVNELKEEWRREKAESGV